MNERTIASLMAHRIPGCDKDQFTLNKRISFEHIFTSIDQCFEYMNFIIDEKSVNPNDITFESYKYKHVFIINVFDEAICSLLYEIYHMTLKSKKASTDDQDLNIMFDLIYARSLELYNKLEPLKDTESDKYHYYGLLMIVLNKLMKLTNSSYTDKYPSIGLSKSYYDLMYTLVNNLEKTDDTLYYNKLLKLYVEFIEKEDIN